MKVRFLYSISKQHFRVLHYIMLMLLPSQKLTQPPSWIRIKK